MRNSLPCGSVIHLKNTTEETDFFIERNIGCGATCIAYEGFMLTNGKKVRCRLKELYPHDAKVVRNGLSLEWTSEKEYKEYEERFTQNNDLLSSLHNDETIGNNITFASVYVGNGTLYSVMNVNYGITYDKDNCKDLSVILKSILVLEKIICNLHDAGYLHLDIKPENFLISYDPNIYIWLFDVDSIMKLSDVGNGKIPGIPYSLSWAAPEQKQGKVLSIGPWTDIFSVGSVLFYKIMGRNVDNDDIGIFSDWDFSDSLLQNVNPSVIRIIRKIFSCTLCANFHKRCSDLQLIELLCKAIDILDKGVPYVVEKCPLPVTEFIGRNHELSEMDTSLKQKRIIFLHGIGGIGKSELSKEYARQHSGEYDAIVFLTYCESLQETLGKISVWNSDKEDDDFDETLRLCLNQNVLIIIDNYDLQSSEELDIESLERFEAKFIITSRTDFSDVLPDDCCQIELGSLLYVELKRLFINLSGIENMNKSEEHQFEKIVQFVEGHTYLIDLLARQIRYSGVSISSLYSLLKQGIGKLAGTARVRAIKDNRIAKATVYDILQSLFDIAKLSECEKQVMRDLEMTDFMVVSSKMYCLCYAMDRAESQNAINDLLERGWLREIDYENIGNRQYLSMHPIVKDLVINNLNPGLGNCPKVYEQLYREIIFFGMDADSNISSLNEARIDNQIEYICDVWKKEIRNGFNYDPLFIKWLNGWFEDDSIDVEPPELGSDWFSQFVGHLFEYVNDDSNDDIQKYEAYRALLHCAFRGYHHFLVGYKRNEDDVEYDEKTCCLFYDALKIAYKMDGENVKRIMELTAETINEVYSYHDYSCCRIFPRMIVDAVNEYNQSLLKNEARYYYGMSIDDATEKIVQQKIDKRMNIYNNDDEENVRQFCDLFWSSVDKCVFLKSYIANNVISEVISCFGSCIDDFFSTIWMKRALKNDRLERFRESLNNFDWGDIMGTLAIYGEFLKACPDNLELEGTTIRDEIQSMMTYRIIVAAIQSNVEMVDKSLDDTFSLYISQFDGNKFSTNDYFFIRGLPLQLSIISSAFAAIGKASYIVDHVIGWCDHLENTCVDFQPQNDSYPEKLYELYQTISWLSSCAKDDASEECREYFASIEDMYNERMKCIENVNYTMNPRNIDE